MKNYIEKTLHGMQEAYNDLFHSEETARKKGLMQAVDPRVKLLSGLALLLIINLSRAIPEIAFFIGYVLLLAACSRMSMGRYLLRIALMALLFTGVLALPSIFSFVRPGDVLLPLGGEIYICKQGIFGALFLTSRSCGSLAVVFLITATTRWTDILKTLHNLRIPSLFVDTLEMMHRYLFLGLEMASQLFMARKSRIMTKPKGREGRRFVAAATGILLIKTSKMAGDVSMAMCARGYQGRIKTLNRFRTSWVDYAWVGWHLLFLPLVIILFN